MEIAWGNDTPHSRFWRRLLRERADEILASPEWLQRLRYNWTELTQTCKRFEHVFKERGIDFMEHVIRNTEACKKPVSIDRSQQKTKPRKIFFLDELPISAGRSWEFWYPIQQSFSDKGLFLPHDIYSLVMKFVPQPQEPLPDWDYDAETADEIGLPMIKII